MYWSSLTGLPAKLSRVVPAYVQWLVKSEGGVYLLLTCKEHNGTRRGAAHSVHDGLGVEMVMGQGDMAAIV